jgi:hypothetical protein
MIYEVLPFTIRNHVFKDNKKPLATATIVVRTFPILRVCKHVNAEASSILVPKLRAEPFRLRFHSDEFASFSSYHSSPDHIKTQVTTIERAPTVDHKTAFSALTTPRRCREFDTYEQPEGDRTLSHFVDAWDRYIRTMSPDSILVTIIFDVVGTCLDLVNVADHTIQKLLYSCRSPPPLNITLRLKDTADRTLLRGRMTCLRGHFEAIAAVEGRFKVQVGDVIGEAEWRTDWEAN